MKTLMFVVGFGQFMAQTSAATSWMEHRISIYKQWSDKLCSELASDFDKLFTPSGESYCYLGDFRAVGASSEICFTSSTRDEALEICQSRGMRLCTNDEIPADGAAGCSLTGTRVWIDALCDNNGSPGYVFGKPLNDNSWKIKYCGDAQDTDSVACCADTAIPNVVGPGGTIPAISQCPEGSARLTNERFGGQHIRGKSACQCYPGYDATYGSLGEGLQSCTYNPGSSYENCAANQYAVRSEDSCEDRDLNTARKDSSVCGLTKNLYGARKCPYPKKNTFYDAEAYCIRAGGRLPSLAEAKKAVHVNTGCKTKNRHIFTSTPCSADGSKVFLFKSRYRKREPNPQSRCVNKDLMLRIAGISCVFDTGSSVKCKDCSDSDATSSSGSTSELGCTCPSGYRSGDFGFCSPQ